MYGIKLTQMSEHDTRLFSARSHARRAGSTARDAAAARPSAGVLFIFSSQQVQKRCATLVVEFSGVDPTQSNLNPRRRRLPENLFDLVCVYSF